jgi:hypothetical protein
MAGVKPQLSTTFHPQSNG